MIIQVDTNYKPYYVNQESKDHKTHTHTHTHTHIYIYIYMNEKPVCVCVTQQ